MINRAATDFCFPAVFGEKDLFRTELFPTGANFTRQGENARSSGRAYRRHE
jgi:hypothetical protein